MVSLGSVPEELRKHILLENIPKYVNNGPADSEGSNNCEYELTSPFWGLWRPSPVAPSFRMTRGSGWPGGSETGCGCQAGHEPPMYRTSRWFCGGILYDIESPKIKVHLRQILGLRPETSVSEECFCLNTSCDKNSTICLGNYNIFYVNVPMLSQVCTIFIYHQTSLILPVREWKYLN